MTRKYLLLIGGVLLIVVIGFTGGALFEDTDNAEEDNSPCITETAADQPMTQCLVTEKPPNMRITNFDDEQHQVFVRIERQSNIVYSKNITLSAATRRPTQRELRNITDRPGEHTISVETAAGESDSVTWTIDNRYCEECTPRIKINEDGTIDVLETVLI